jgi:hypothetical protein
VIKITGLLLFLLLNFLIISHLRQLFQYADIMGVVYGKKEIAEEVFDQIVKVNEKDKIFSEAVLWKSEGKVPVSAENTEKEQIVSLYQMKGQQGAVFGRGLCAGRYFTKGESSVCLLDKETVRKIFGSDNVLGMKVKWGDGEYKIAGLLAGKQPLCIIPAKEGAFFDGIAMKKTKKASSSKMAFGILETAVGGIGLQRIDGALYYMTACLIYFLMTAVFVFAFGIKAGRRKVVVILCMVLAAEILIMGIGLAAPGSDYLPSYWSDFDFFVQLFKEKKVQVQELLHHQEFVSWQQMLGMWIRTVGMEMILGVSGGMCMIITHK